MSARINLKGNRFGTLIVLSFHEIIIAKGIKDKAYWMCKCMICGSLKKASSASLNNGSGAGCNKCLNESRWNTKEKERLKVCKDYLEGKPLSEITTFYGLNCDRDIYKILKKHGYKANRNG